MLSHSLYSCEKGENVPLGAPVSGSHLVDVETEAVAAKPLS